jgi:hypothetical protein
MFSAAKSSAPAGGAITLTKSLRLRRSASTYLSRTPASASNQTTWTYSAWVKRGIVDTGTYTIQNLFGVTNGSTDSTWWVIAFMPNGSSSSIITIQSWNNVYLRTTAVFIDTSAWYHIVVALDTTQATSSNRIKLYINGVQVTAFSGSALTQNSTTPINNTLQHQIGRDISEGYYSDYYITDINFVDGQQLTPSSFGATDATSGQWVPARYSGTYGTNGFHLPFTNVTSTTTLGYDTSGNSNNWTTNNISLTAGSTYDSMNDVPVAYSATAANYAVLNPNGINGTTPITLSNGNLSFTWGNPSNKSAYSTMGMSSGKWYCEVIYTTVGSSPVVGVSNVTGADTSSYCGFGATQYGYESGAKHNNNANVAYGATFTNNDLIGVAFDADAGSITFYKNGVSQGVAFSSIPAGTYVFGVSANNSTGSINFGQQPFVYTPPSGYLALNTYNLPTPSIVNGTLYMDASLYTGNRTARSITNASGFKPDFVWIKARNSAEYNTLTDSNRGVNSQLFSDRANAQESNTDAVTSFNSNGFSLGTNSTGTFCYVNQNSSWNSQIFNTSNNTWS